VAVTVTVVLAEFKEPYKISSGLNVTKPYRPTSGTETIEDHLEDLN
jgi:hypothetical protein